MKGATEAALLPYHEEAHFFGKSCWGVIQHFCPKIVRNRGRPAKRAAREVLRIWITRFFWRVPEQSTANVAPNFCLLCAGSRPVRIGRRMERTIGVAIFPVIASLTCLLDSRRRRYFHSFLRT